MSKTKRNTLIVCASIWAALTVAVVVLSYTTDGGASLPMPGNSGPRAYAALLVTIWMESSIILGAFSRNYWGVLAPGGLIGSMVGLAWLLPHL